MTSVAASDGSAIAGEKRTRTGTDPYSYTLYYMYDENGEAIGFTYKPASGYSDEYYYGKNLQGDVTGIYNWLGEKVVSYTYDAWGNVINITGMLASTIGEMNPLRYRGYYYDTESGMYYLNARYYNPKLCRFITQDSILGANGDILSYNLFAYCSNNPVMYADPSGQFIKELFEEIGKELSKMTPVYTIFSHEMRLDNAKI